MIRYLLILLTCSLLSGCVSCPSTTVCFTPGENCTNLIIDSVEHAKGSVLVQAYQFTSKPIAESLVQAKKRGVDIKVILDESQTIVVSKMNDKFSLRDYPLKAASLYVSALSFILENTIVQNIV